MSIHQVTTQELQIVYQSNEIVPVSGQYEVVQSRPVERRVRETGPLSSVDYEPKVLHFTQGEMFPNVEGRSVAWRLVHTDR